MPEPVARSLRTAERFLLAPPLQAEFASKPIAVCDISASGARLRHPGPLQSGSKGVLRLPVEGRIRPLAVESMVVWTQPDSADATGHVTGVRMYGSAEAIASFLSDLHEQKRSNRIEELRATDRFYVAPAVEGYLGDVSVRIADLSKCGARIECDRPLQSGESTTLRFALPGTELEITAAARVVWCSVKAVGSGEPLYHAGLVIREKVDQLRLAIGQLCEIDRAVLDTHSLLLKLKVMRARARQLAGSQPPADTGGVAPEQYLLVQGVREELRLNPEEAMHWYRRARITISDPATRTVAPLIADHPDALAVWEYLDRSVDPSIVGRAFAIGV